MARAQTPPLHADLAARILRQLAAEGAQPGKRLVELELCAAFGVSRTPVRGALKLLAAQGLVRAGEGRGYVLAKLPAALPEAAEDSDEARLFDALADARARGRLAGSFTQQEIVRRFKARLSTVLAVLRELAELGVLERKAGNGWAFTADAVLGESYAFRRALEPQMLLQPGFKLDRAWAEKSRLAHQALKTRAWTREAGAAFHALNADFHEQLARLSGNRTMARAIGRQNRLRRFLGRAWDYPREQVMSAIDDHLEILAALEAGYADKAAALMLHHLTTSGPPRAA